MLTLTAADDTAVEADAENLVFTLSAVAGGLDVPDGTSVTVAIRDDDTPVPVSGSATISLSHRGNAITTQSVVTEGDIIQARVSLSQAQLTEVRIPITGGADITGDTSGATTTAPTAVIPAGSTSVDVQVYLRLDGADENDETLTLGLGTPTYGRTISLGGITTTGATADVKVKDVSAASQHHSVSADGGRQLLLTLDVDTGRNLRSHFVPGGSNRIDLTYSVAPTGHDVAWRLAGAAADADDLTATDNGDGTSTVTLPAGDIPSGLGAHVTFELYVTPAAGTSRAFTPTVTLSGVGIRDGSRAKQLVPAAYAAVANRVPSFTEDSYAFELAENADGSMTAVAVGTVAAADADSGDTLSYSITAGNTGGVFAIDSASGAITYTGRGEDYESFANANAAAAAFTLTVQVSDDATPPASASATVTIGVTNVNEPPTANAGTDQSVNEGVEVTLSGSGTDPEDQSLNYRWTVPSGSGIVLSDATAAEPTFTAPDRAANYQLVFLLVVNDGANDSAPDTVTINVTAPNDAPTAPQVANRTATVGTPFSYTFGASSDADGGTPTYTAQLVTGDGVTDLPTWLDLSPAARTFSCDAAGSGACVAGEYKIRVTATDSESTPASRSKDFRLLIFARAGRHPRGPRLVADPDQRAPGQPVPADLRHVHVTGRHRLRHRHVQQLRPGPRQCRQRGRHREGHQRPVPRAGLHPGCGRAGQHRHHRDGRPDLLAQRREGGRRLRRLLRRQLGFERAAQRAGRHVQRLRIGLDRLREQRKRSLRRHHIPCPGQPEHRRHGSGPLSRSQAQRQDDQRRQLSLGRRQRFYALSPVFSVRATGVTNTAPVFAADHLRLRPGGKRRRQHDGGDRGNRLGQ